jgi:carboxylesterase
MSTVLLILLLLISALLLTLLFVLETSFTVYVGFAAVFVLLFFVILKLVDSYKINKRKIIFSSFNKIEELGCFTETKPRFYPGNKKVERSVLLIHGFSASVNEFSLLTERLIKENIPFYAPMLTGFGLDDYNLLKKIRVKDWLRDVVHGYEFLSGFSEKVSIIGHSMGGLLALYIAATREIDKLIITAPYLVHNSSHSLMKHLLRFKYVKEFFLSINPVINKFSRDHYNKLYKSSDKQNHRFAIPTFPLSSVAALWELQDIVDYKKLTSTKPLVLTGRKDNTITSSTIHNLLNKYSIPYSSIEFSDSGHNLLEDKEKDSVIEVILKELKR